MTVSVGKVCAEHPELNGQRRNGNCPACQRARKRTKPSREVQRRKIKKYRAANCDKYLAGAKLRTAAARMRRAEATVGDKVAIGIAYREMKRRAALRGMTVDHMCRWQAVGSVAGRGCTSRQIGRWSAAA